MALRRYGPGKFNLVIDQYIYDLSLDGTDDEKGGTSEYGVWFGLFKGPLTPDPQSASQYGGGMTLEEIQFLRRQRGGAIITENDQGFVEVDYYTTRKALMADWRRIDV